jgi:UDP-N-acetylmuramate--alanine ligase
MRALPLNIGPIHFVGIGGIGMSGIAEVLHNLGYTVQGSDIAEGYNIDRLREAGITVMIGHDAANIGAAQVIVTSTAVKRDNPEVVAARSRLIPVVRRAEMLAELMRLKWGIAIGGTHGKTTTTSLVATVLEAAKLDPTVINGGIINAYGTNTRLGEGEWMVVEADESDGSFLRLPAVAAVVTNMDPEHLDHWGTEEAMKQGYAQFVGNIPFYGFAVLCADHPNVQAMIPSIDRRLITYGFSQQADVRAERLITDRMGATFEVTVHDRATGRTRQLKPMRLPMLGQHNVQNALAAIAVGIEMDIDEGTIRSALAGFKGVKRRFTRVGEANGIQVIDDYGHHPVEIAAVLKAARQAGARDVIAVVQPHRYSRLKALFEDFCQCMNDAGTVIVADVYAAGEQKIEGFDRDALVDGLRSHGHRSVVPLPGPDSLPEMINAIRATTSSASAPATSPPGPPRCRRS